MMTLAICHILLTDQNGHTISREEAGMIGQQFASEYVTKQHLELEYCETYQNSIDPMGTGWSLAFGARNGNKFRMKLDLKGGIDWFERSGNGDAQKGVATQDWYDASIQKGLKLIEKSGNKGPIGIPGFYKKLPRWTTFFFPILANGKQFVGGHVGYRITFEDPNLSLVNYHRSTKIPQVNATFARITADQALKEARLVFPTDNDFEHRSGTQKNSFGTPKLVYYCEDPDKDMGFLAWYMTLDSRHNTGYAIQGYDCGIVVDALTGKYIKTKYSLTAFL